MGKFNAGDQIVFNGATYTVLSWPADDQGFFRASRIDDARSENIIMEHVTANVFTPAQFAAKNALPSLPADAPTMEPVQGPVDVHGPQTKPVIPAGVPLVEIEDVVIEKAGK